VIGENRPSNPSRSLFNCQRASKATPGGLAYRQAGWGENTAIVIVPEPRAEYVGDGILLGTTSKKIVQQAFTAGPNLRRQ